jgi:SAM-dependent methyltransferase
MSLSLQIYSLFFRLFEGWRVFFRYYKNLHFFAADLLLKTGYLFKGPHRISRHYLKFLLAPDEIYGETPLTTLDAIASNCSLFSKDTLLEMGSGTGRAAFWLRLFIGCSVVGIEKIPPFVAHARRVKRWLALDRLTFIEGDFSTLNLTGITAIYLYGTALSDEHILQLVHQFQRLPPGTKVITVTYPLTEYDPTFTLIKQFPAHFPWGKTEVYLNIKNVAL